MKTPKRLVGAMKRAPLAILGFLFVFIPALEDERTELRRQSDKFDPWNI